MAAAACRLVLERARGARVDELTELLRKHAEHEPLGAADDHGKTALHHAAEANPHVGSVKLLIERSAPDALSVKCDLEMLPIHWACKLNTSMRVIELLVDQGGAEALNARDIMHMLPIHHAAHRNANPEVIKHLVVKGGPEMLAAQDAMGMLPIHLAGDNSKEAYNALAVASPKTLTDRDAFGNMARHDDVDTTEILSPQQQAITSRTCSTLPVRACVIA